ncbi:catabolic L-serine/threonine dehydratase [Exophiala xenobiotica]|nr:catabolic L-serine/threonine dehydratase [Exophiala xenobiotica]KAK5366469.1 catabolic L-serine/threonine dehydratase [Exophiala xenobiotica]KAK5395087.1 catabolic L-serine/threonine dehydratase [Exophiala xenobiotica]KAK5412911.1 catabolic L-serine/threonine dehydratase [Exophiala xenobiotica]KAK5461545.1 catabolic L-serine/threonine dehydratase [Exophiala xenobiotica]
MASLKKPWIETPLLESSILSKIEGCRIFLKLENLQPSSSFKSRGIGNAMLKAIQDQNPSDDRDVHFYSSSGGNAGLACVTAAMSLDHKSSVVVPTSTDERTIQKLRAAGASEVLVHGDNWFHADQYLRETCIPEAENRGERGIYIHPFDNPAIWEGAASMVDEIKAQMPDNTRPDAIICSVGGGGLFAGIMRGLDRVGWGDGDGDGDDQVQVLPIETHGADSLAQSLQKGELITLPAITSVATSLGAIRVAEHAFQQAQRPNVTPVVLDDAEACAACWRFLDDERYLVEPACGVSVALAYDGRLKHYLKGFRPDSKVVIIVCGGSKITLELLNKYQRTYQRRSEELAAKYA